MHPLMSRFEPIWQEYRALDAASQASCRLLPYHAEQALGELQHQEEQLPRITDNVEQWLQEFEASELKNSADYRTLIYSSLQSLELFLLQGQGSALSLLGRFAEAQQVLQRCREMFGDSPHHSLGFLFHEQGRIALYQAKYAEALQFYHKAYDAFMQFTDAGTWKDIVSPEDMQSCARGALQSAAETLGSIAQAVLQGGDREAFLTRQQAAVVFAREHEFSDLAWSLLLNLYQWQLQWDAGGTIVDSLQQQLAEFTDTLDSPTQNVRKVQKLLLEFEHSMAGNSKARARHRLNKAKDILDQYPELVHSRLMLHRAFSSFYEWQAKYDQAMEHAETACNMALQMEIPDLIQQEACHLVTVSDAEDVSADRKLRARNVLDQAIAMLTRLQARDALAQALLQRAASYYMKEKNHDAALEDINRAGRHAGSRDLRRDVLLAQIAALNACGRKEEALGVTVSAIKLCSEQMSPQEQMRARGYRDLLQQTEVLHEAAAMFAADLGRPDEAFSWLEEGKSRLLAQQLAQSNVGSQGKEDAAGIGYTQELRRALGEESAGVLFFCVGAGRTLILVVDPVKDRPQSFFVDLGEAELEQAKLAQEVWPEQSSEDDAFVRFLGELSEKLVKPLEEALQEIMDHCSVLYIVPDSRLYLVPFSALTMKGVPLVEHDHCALAVIPSVSFLYRDRTRRPRSKERTCLAVGVGRAGEFSLAEQAREIMAGCPRGLQPVFLLDDEEPVSSDRIWNMAKGTTVLHFSCHGMEESTSMDTLSALYLELSEHEKWFAKDIFEHKGELQADLVFLNACMAGRFRLHDGLVVGGFWEAFLHAGASSVIAPLAEVHPEDAGVLAGAFYRIWLQGEVSKARALQLAQQELRRKKHGSFHWARYVIIGAAL